MQSCDSFSLRMPRMRGKHQSPREFRSVRTSAVKPSVAHLASVCVASIARSVKHDHGASIVAGTA